MAQPQKGVCAEPNLHGLFLMFNVIDDDMAGLRQRLAGLLELFHYYEQEYFEAMLSGVIAIGSNFWHDIYPDAVPAELAPFPNLTSKEPPMPVLPFDLFIQIRADRADVCFQLGTEVCRILERHCELVEQVKGFRFLDGRDLTGFLTAYDNPRGMAKLDVAIVGDEDPDFCGGSYVHVQRYQHSIRQWNRLSQAEQEYIIGRRRDDNQRLTSEFTHAANHSTRIATDGQGNPLRLLRQSMPYGDMQEQGLYFISCASSPWPFTELLEQIIAPDQDGQFDRLLEFTSAQTGAAFFAPSVNFIRDQAHV